MEIRDSLNNAEAIAESIIDFWFSEIDSKFWFKKDSEFDDMVRERFEPLVKAAMKGECFGFRGTPSGRLAEIILLDQFTRNIYRDTPRAFTGDTLALILSQELVREGIPPEFSDSQKAFGIMPFMHSESAFIHEKALQLFSAKGLEYFFEFEVRHKKIIDRFGRYPHRNSILGRESSLEEVEFLKQPGSSF